MRGLLLGAFAVLGSFGAVGSALPAHGRDVPPALAVVVDSPVAERWFGQAGIPYIRRNAASLSSTPISGASVLVLPMECVTTPAAARHVQDFLSTGGSVVALYWGTLEEGEDRSGACYRLAPTLGIVPSGWEQGTAAPMVITDPGLGATPGSGREVRLSEVPFVTFQPTTGSRVVASWANIEGGDGKPAGAAVLRGRSLYLGANLLRPASASREGRELLFWAIQRVAPRVGLEWQARDRLATASAAWNSLSAASTSDPNPALGAEADGVRALLTEARAHLAGNSPVRATLTAERARVTAEAILERHRRTPDKSQE